LPPPSASCGRSTAPIRPKSWSSLEGGGYIWHTTGSGKTLTSFKAARLATELEFIDKVFFVVDRKDLDYQTMKEYQRFSPDSVNGSDSTAGLKRNLDKDDNKIIVTTIQKLNNLMKSEGDLPSTASRWYSFLMSVTAASLVRRRRT
jgi:type I restriction enzyme, R subunit